MNQDQIDHYVSVGIRAECRATAAAVYMSIKELERALQEAGGNIYTSSRFAPHIRDMRTRLDAFEAAIQAKEALIGRKEETATPRPLRDTDPDVLPGLGDPERDRPDRGLDE